MKLVFKIDYRTAWGEALYITGNIAALGNGDAGKLRAMQLDGLEKWALEIEVPDDTRDLTYSYVVRHENGGERREWGRSAISNSRPASPFSNSSTVAGSAVGQTLLFVGVHRLYLPPRVRAMLSIPQPEC
mgnify:CR=1 FL=1